MGVGDCRGGFGGCGAFVRWRGGVYYEVAFSLIWRCFFFFALIYFLFLSFTVMEIAQYRYMIDMANLMNR